MHMKIRAVVLTPVQGPGAYYPSTSQSSRVLVSVQQHPCADWATIAIPSDIDV